MTNGLSSGELVFRNPWKMSNVEARMTNQCRMTEDAKVGTPDYSTCLTIIRALDIP